MIDVLPKFVVLGLLAAIVVALSSSAQLGFFVALFTILAWWTWEQPEDALLFLLVLAPILPMIKITQTIGTVTLLKDVIILTLFIRLFLLPLFTKKLPYRRNPLALSLLALVIWVAINTLRADDLTLGILRARDIVLYLMLYVGVLFLPDTKGFNIRIVRWFIAGATVVMLLAGYQWFFAADSAVLRFDPARSIWIPRVSSILAHPSILGQYLAMYLILAIALLANLRGRVLKVSLSCLGLVGILLVYLTYSRAVWIGLAVALIAMTASFSWQWLKTSYQISSSNINRLLIGIVILIGIGVIGLRYAPSNTFVRSIFDPGYGSNAERLEFAARLIAPMTNSEALIGRGLGDVTAQQFRTIEVTANDIATGAGQVVREAKDRTLVDNQYLKTFVELGLIGLLIYLWIFWHLAKSSWHLTKHSIIGLSSFGFFAFFIVQGLFIDIWEIFPTNATFWIIAALLARQLTPSKPAA